MRANTMRSPTEAAFPSATAVRQLQTATTVYWRTVEEVSRTLVQVLSDAEVVGPQYDRLLESLTALVDDIRAVAVECHRLLGEVAP